MKHIHNQEKEQFKKLFALDCIDCADDRYKVLEVFLQTEQHVTIGELRAALSKEGHELRPEFVRETMELMCRFGFARRNQFDQGEIRYEHLHLGQHHDHMICTQCLKIIEFQSNELEAMQEKITREYGFHMLQHRMEIYGICSECSKNRTHLMQLVMTKAGERVVVKNIEGGTGAHTRLSTMGIRVGDVIDVITNQSMGQVVVAVDQKRFALGRGMARKIIVQPLRDDDAA
jgi:Fur family transcriptional regulator, ferric uptake regulator